MAIALPTLSTLTASGCASAQDDGSGDVPEDEDFPPLPSFASLVHNTPDPASLPLDGKADAVYPAQFDLIATQTPVKSQGSRGTCSFFATCALMEHMALLSGEASGELDLSEQHAVWLVKQKDGHGEDREGSDPATNLTSYAQWGVVQEEAWPYEPSAWDEDDDPACVGALQQRPVRCHTNGSPPSRVQGAERWHVGAPFHINSTPQVVKHYLQTTGRAAVLSLPVHCQAWNYRSGCPRPASTSLWHRGVVSYPNEADRQGEGAGSSGHAVLLVGWDDNYEAPRRDAEGETLVDDNGDPLLERGFFIIKNSWGTSSFGRDNPYGPGYGLVSMQYVAEFGRLVMATAPGADPERCDDGVDNDGDGRADCADSDCEDLHECLQGQAAIYSSAQALAIPDGDPAGVTSELLVVDDRPIAGLAVRVNLTHPWTPSLTLTLSREGYSTEVLLRQEVLDSTEDLDATFYVSQFAVEPAEGVWRLGISDTEQGDEGRLNGWSLEVIPCVGGWDCENGRQEYGNYYSGGPIPDGTGEVFTSEIEVFDDDARIRRLSVYVSMEHPAWGDLTLTLRAPDGKEVALVEASGASGPWVAPEISAPSFDGTQAGGKWTLSIKDEADGDAGSLSGWDLFFDGEY